jgi:predicted patatin/cPLA2 family phospholipase
VQTVDGHHDGSDRYDPVVALLRSRRESGSKPGARGTGDHARLALLVEGGGMRGVVSAAMMCALDDGGFKDALDDVYATSAGAMNAAYFLAGETWFPLSIYYDDLATRKFVDFLRPLRGKPVMSLDYAFDEVVRHRKPLDVDAILHSPTAFHVTLTLLDPARSCAVSDFRSGSDLIDTLRASCWLPIATSGTATWRGVRAVDGGVLAPTLEGLARERGVTHVLSLQTRGAGEPRANRVGRWYVRRRLDQLEPGLGDAYEAAVAASRRSEPERWPPPHHRLSVLPLPDGEVARHEVRPYRLLAAARSAYGVMYAVLEGRSPSEVSDGTIQVAPRLAVLDRASEPARRGLVAR